LLRFILNNKEVNTDLPPGVTVLDYVRYHKNMKGTKIGCREGDCGACTILVGELNDESVTYRSFTSCLTPLGNIHNKHVVTIEGLNVDGLNMVQQCMQQASATQCGFCTPGFVVSLAAFCLSDKPPTLENALAAIDGNICRCTGYKSIERAAEAVAVSMQNKGNETSLDYITRHQLLPSYFSGIRKRLSELALPVNGKPPKRERILGGGTDLYVQQPDQLKDASIRFLFNEDLLKDIRKQGNKCVIGAAVTVTALLESAIIQTLFPHLNRYLKLVSSTPIRNMATVGGNLVNASPIGDLTIFFLELNTTVQLSDGNKRREVLLRNFFKGYKRLAMLPEEYVESISFDLPDGNTFFHFEKVSKRTYLDIASVNSAIQLKIRGDIIEDAYLSAGGVAPVPMFLKMASAHLKGRNLSASLITEILEIVNTEIAPISDVRGTAAYKRLLLKQLIKAHFLTLFPNLPVEELLQL